MNQPTISAEIVDHYEYDFDESQRISAGFGELPHRFTTAYFHHPDELGAEAAEEGVSVVELVVVARRPTE